MKRFNIDEFIWFLTLILFTWIMFYFYRSGRITYFIDKEMIKYFYVSIGIMVIFSVFQIKNIFKHRARTEISNKFLPLIFTIIICIVFLYVIPIMKSSKVDSLLENEKIEESGVLVISNNNYQILNEIEFKEEVYDGQKIYMIGFIKRDKELKNDEGYLSREVISCCQSDKSMVKVRIKGLNNNYTDGTWVKAIGVINFDNGWYIDALELENTDEPYNIFFHETL